jgi:hypothetical protein
MVKSEIMKSVIKSYLRGVLVAVTPLIAINSTDSWAYLMAIFAGVIGPALRAVDSKDPAFGMIADTIEVGIDKMAKASKKTTAKKAVKKTVKKQ